MMDVPKKQCCPLKDTLQMRLNVLSYNSTNVWERDGKRSRRPILATRCFCGLGRGDERGVAGGIGGLERAVTDRVLKREEGGAFP
jgi:hypothetical protein